MGQHESNTKLIWQVFGFLSIVTIVEVILGIIKPHGLHFTNFLGTSLLNWIFIILTLVKAAGIMWYFMHMNHERKNFVNSIILPLIILIPYLVTLLLIEGHYIHEVMGSYINWKY
ncbi:cytochrome C oxidase subunit IV family protein [Wenyingzhuangia marina]|uniref:Cytochrome C oxidase subunit IV n=1 Tax=Wenyingzhuangia marina TaxID=1195760 RepID=A0A1M5WHD7_9FLAO|nr:cytochrome C oxidase subunit IV family protein [Wenyingzhuangia marina]GGF80863.1 cytochrome c oxidase subunit IV [Wenyingzhuangia marina]SHH86941.1 Cytochrome C oxidase subunit IV [Wenyingzhuangia marina]